MRSGPDGGLSKRKHNRLNLKSAVALATLSLAGVAPANAQTPQSAQQGVLHTEAQNEDIQFVAEALEALKSAKRANEWYRELRLGSDSEDVERERIIAETEPLIQDKKYLDGLKILRARGAKVAWFVGRVDPHLITNHEGLNAKLDRIPPTLLPFIQISRGDLTEDLDYTGDGLQALAERIAAVGEKASTGQLIKVLDYDKKTPGFSSGILSAIEGSQGKVSFQFIFYRIEFGDFAPSSLLNQSFLSGLIRFANEGFNLSDLYMLKKTDATRVIAEERISDPLFVDAALGSKKLGYDTLDVLAWNPDTYRNPLFLKNAEALKRLINAKQYDLSHYKDALILPDLEETLTKLPEDDRKDILYYLQKFKGDALIWSQMQVIINKYSNRPRVISDLRYLGAERLKDPDYMRTFDAVVAAPPKDPRFPDMLLRSQTDSTFVEEKTGFELDRLRDSLPQYLEQWERADRSSLLFKILDESRSRALYRPILMMNQLHEETGGRRLSELKDLNSRALFQVLIIGGADAYLSTFRLMYNGNGFAGPEVQNSFLARVKSEYGTVSAFFQAVRPDHKIFGTFLELLSQNDIMDTFLRDVGSPDDQHAILREFLFDASTGIDGAQALTLSDLLRTTKAEPIREFVFGELRGVQEKATDKSGKIAGLLVADYFQGKRDVPDWARASVQEYGKYFPEIRDLPKEKAFRMENGIERNVQVHLFYDDRGKDKPESAWDGHGSFKNFIASLGGSVSWNKDGAIQRVTVNRGYNLQDKGDYLIIRQTDSRTKREIVMYANKPDRNDETVAKVGEELIKSEKPQVVVHRGHSYHAGKTIKLITPDTAMVNLGSCGGAKNITDVLAKAPSAQVMATRGVGTMLVNDKVIPAFNRTLLRDGNVTWVTFGTQMTAEFKKRGGLAQERWGSYQMPDKNRIAHLIAALKAMEK